MTITANLHNIAKAKAEASGGASWLLLSDGEGNELAAFMPRAQAEAMADAFNAAKPQVREAA